jgi:hypothetical protein
MGSLSNKYKKHALVKVYPPLPMRIFVGENRRQTKIC